jgi:signal transduction histidine kinase
MLAGPVPGSDGATRERVDRLERLLEAGRFLMSDPDVDKVLEQIGETARDLTLARYATLTPLGHGGEATGAERRGPGVLCVPVSSSRAGLWGNLCVGEKQSADGFDDDDLDALVVLAGWAAMAIDRDMRQHELDRALRTRRTAMEIATAIGSDTGLSHILELIVGRARELVAADGLLIWLRHGDQLRVAAVAGNADVPDHSAVPLAASTAGEALLTGRSVRVENAQEMQISPAEFGMSQASSALLVPLVHRGRGLGVLVAFDHHGATASFDADDERALEAFAASAATAVATAWLVEEQRLQDSIAAAESERGRWARELHDETLQGLASLKLTLAGALKLEPDRARSILQSSIAQIERDIDALRAIIADLRPAALDELGLEPALRTLVADVAQSAGLDARVSVELGAERLAADAETIAYRVAQEALTNIVKHAGARTVTVDVVLGEGVFRLAVADDGCGITESDAQGYGLVGMRERAALAAGEVRVTPADGGGTRVTLELPVG